MTLDWDDLRFFLALARHETLSAAARALGTSQPTVGRRLVAFERRLGSKLFRRLPSGFEPTAAGRDILARVERIERETLAIERSATGRDVGVTGKIRVTAPEWLTSHVLAPFVADFSARHPALVAQVIAEARWLDLLRREADVALRLARFERAEIVQRALAPVGFALYASRRYLARHGAPRFDRGCEGHALVAPMEDALLAETRWLDAIAPNARVACRANARQTHLALAVAGAGLTCLPCYLGDRAEELVRLRTPNTPPARTLWLGVHRDARDVPRVRGLSDFLARAFAPLRAELRGASR